jgi:prephenate dehydratase
MRSLPSLLAQVNLRVKHCLLALPGVPLGDVKRVMSHPQVPVLASDIDAALRSPTGAEPV